MLPFFGFGRLAFSIRRCLTSALQPRRASMVLAPSAASGRRRYRAFQGWLSFSPRKVLRSSHQ